MHNTHHYGDDDDDVNTIIAQSMLDGSDPTRTYGRRLNASREKFEEYYNAEESVPEWARDMEQILRFYRQELQPESNNQAHVHHQFILRLIDLLRPTFHDDEKKLSDFDQLFQDIIALYERETQHQKKTIDSLSNEVTQWRSMAISNDKPQRPNPNVINADLMELNESMKHLHQLLELQKNRIQELTELVSEQLVPDHTPEPSSRAHGPSDWSEMVRICPTCQAIFHIRSITTEQFNAHVNGHYDFLN